MKKQAIIFLLGLVMPFFGKAQENDISIDEEIRPDSAVAYSPSNSIPSPAYLKKLLIPSTLIAYGALSVGNHRIKSLNSSWRNKIIELQIGRNSADDYTQFVPVSFVYGLNFSGVKGKNSIGDITLVSVSSFLISTAIVRPLKELTVVRRPDGSNDHSFPSGHTSTAFVSAQFMYREYRDNNFWLSLVGYPFAAYTALARTVNDKHWLGDIVAGAGIGILSTELAYYLLPYIKKLSKGFAKGNNLVYPVYQANAYGLGLKIKL